MKEIEIKIQDTEDLLYFQMEHDYNGNRTKKIDRNNPLLRILKDGETVVLNKDKLTENHKKRIKIIEDKNKASKKRAK